MPNYFIHSSTTFFCTTQHYLIALIHFNSITCRLRRATHIVIAALSIETEQPFIWHDALQLSNLDVKSIFASSREKGTNQRL